MCSIIEWVIAVMEMLREEDLLGYQKGDYTLWIKRTLCLRIPGHLVPLSKDKDDTRGGLSEGTDLSYSAKERPCDQPGSF